MRTEAPHPPDLPPRPMTGKLGQHVISVPQCIGPASFPDPSAQTGPVYRFTPCRKPSILVDGEELIVDGRSYGTIEERSPIRVDSSGVSVDGELKQLH